jgi:hypothetical protein
VNVKREAITGLIAGWRGGRSASADTTEELVTEQR